MLGWVVSLRRGLLVLVVRVRVWGLLVVWLARSVPVPVPVLVVGGVRVVACRVMHTLVVLVRRVLLLVVRWVLVRALPVPVLVLVWALVVVSRVSVLVCQALRARCLVRQRRLVPLLVRAVVVAVV